MKIVSHDLYFVHLPVRRDHTWASKMEAPIGHHIILRIRTDDGVEGWGEAPPIATWGGAGMRYYGETPETARHVIDTICCPRSPRSSSAI